MATEWTLERLTMNLGVRYDYFRTSYPDHSVAATQYVPTDRFVEGQVAVRWHDLSPRLGLAYDLFGDGKTALKLSAGRYVVTQGVESASDINPIPVGANNSNPRRWTDTNNDRIVQGDPINPAANGELGPSTNLRFGLPIANLRHDPDWAFGFGNRPYNWEFSAGFQRELAPRVSASVAYFRRIYGGFTAVVNQAVTPADYRPYCVTTPADQRLPSGGGQAVCGLFDLNADKVGLVDRVTVSASNFGEQYERWSGFDLTVQARLPNTLLQGGVSTGTTSADTCAIVTQHPEVVLTAPREAYWLTSGPSTPTDFCHIETPWAAQTQVKLLGSYMLPWDVQVAATYQQLPGPPLLANATYTSAQIAPSLGRGLASASAVTVNIALPGTSYGDRLNQFDLRLSKTFRVQGLRLQGMLDVYNAFNNNVVTFPETNYGATTGPLTGASWLLPRAILPARLVKFGIQADF